MNSKSALEEANQITVHRLLRRYLSPGSATVLTIEGACVTAQRIGNRFGVPRDAITYWYVFEHPDLGFLFDARAVWRCGDLMQPTATHAVILDYEDRGGHYGEHAVRLAVQGWLQTVPL